jgi:hypothetical protein
VIPRAGYTIRHSSDGASDPMAAGDGTFMLRDTFSVHEGRETNWNVYRIVVHLTAEALPAFKARQGDAAFRESNSPRRTSLFLSNRRSELNSTGSCSRRTSAAAVNSTE